LKNLIKKSGLLFILVMGISFQVGAESTGELVYPLYSPLFLGGGASSTRMDTPQAASINAAASGNFQRMILDLNYINLSGWTTNGMGHSLNAALAYPSKYGVFTGAFHFMTTDGLNADSMDFGTFGSLNGSFSKEIYKNLFAGFGISGSLGTNMDWGGSLNLGIIHKPGTIAGMKNFRWGATLNQIGKGYGSVKSGTYLNTVPNIFSLQVGAGFDIIDKQDFKWAIRGDVGLPAASDIKIELGQDITIQKNLRISTSSSLILSDSLKGHYQTIIPSVGVYYNLNLKPKSGGKTKKQTSQIEFQGAVAPQYDGVAAIGAGVTIPFGVRDVNPPVITYDDDGPIYISPNLNGVQDELDIKYSADDERYIAGYTFSIFNDKGDLVKEFKNKDERPENESFKNIFDRMFAPASGTALPETFRWDGVMDSGDIAPDGVYHYKMAFWDDNDNRSETAPMTVVIDTIAPEVTIEKKGGPDLIFSPDGDGNKDTFQIKQSGSEELLWTGLIKNQKGDTVKTFDWKNSSPQDLIWDGTDDDGNILPDGVYNYIVKSTDPSGNSGSDRMDNILINTERPPVSLTINNAWLSPGNSEGIDSINFGPMIPVTSGITEWELQVQDMQGKTFWSYNSRRAGVLEIPKSIQYSGEAGSSGTLAEGKYRGYLKIQYQNGYTPDAYSPGFTVDKTAPVGKVSGGQILSPDGDGFKDTLTLFLETSEEDYWEGFIKDSNNQTVKSYFWRGKADPQIIWDGRDQEGRPVPDGKYAFHLEAFDKAGNRGLSAPHYFTLDTREMSIQLTVSDDAFSPDNNGIKDEVKLFTVIDNPDTVESWSLKILAEADQSTIKTWEGKGRIQQTYQWKGESDKGGTAADGLYHAELTVVYKKGDRPSVKSSVFEKDTKAPVLTASANRLLFSPDGDHSGDNILISQTSSNEGEVKGEITSSDGTIIRTWFWKESISDLTWDGTDSNGNIVPDGSYNYSLSATDAAGNSSVTKIENIVIDTQPTPVYLTAKNSLFSPLSEEFSSQIFTVHVTNQKDIQNWFLNIKDKDDVVVRTITGNNASVPSQLVWDGRSDKGKLMEGSFVGEIHVNYKKGNKPSALSREFLVDNTAPLVGIELSPVPFSPDDDNVDDELKISLNIRDISPIRDWEMVIRDPKGKEFITFGGKGRPSERIIWDGRSRQGELVQSAEDYPYEIRVTDFLGHSTTEKGLIPVDILVIREGDRFKVRISNITFQPYKATLVDIGEQGDKNTNVLKRLSEVLKKYGSYNILIEGHAVSEYYNNPARAAREEKEELQPLSLARAKAVKEYLNKLGIQDSRMSVTGKGGTEPIVPNSDLENRWKNRRVEFILIK